MIIPKTCAFCGWRDAVAWAARNGKPYRICATCQKPVVVKGPRAVGLGDTIRRAVAEMDGEITAAALTDMFPKFARSSVSMALQSMAATGDLVVARREGRACIYVHPEAA